MRRTFTTSPVGLGLVALVAMLLVAPAAWAQQTGSIAGQVTDTTGGALPGVTVEVSSPALIGGDTGGFHRWRGSLPCFELTDRSVYGDVHVARIFNGPA